MNMLAFVVDLVSSEFPDLLGVVADLASLRSAQLMKYSDVETSIKDLRSSCNKIAELMVKYSKFIAPPDHPEVIDEAQDHFMITSKIHPYWLLFCITPF
jgi:hypothetical protein